MNEWSKAVTEKEIEKAFTFQDQRPNEWIRACNYWEGGNRTNV